MTDTMTILQKAIVDGSAFAAALKVEFDHVIDVDNYDFTGDQEDQWEAQRDSVVDGFADQIGALFSAHNGALTIRKHHPEMIEQAELAEAYIAVIVPQLKALLDRF